MIGTTLSHYRIEEKIGAGGMGEVYRATDTKLGREVAIKVLPEAFAKDPERLARFDQEARLLASLNHPNIAAIHGLEESEGTRFLVLELVPGETLAERIDHGPLPVDEALQVCRQIAEALEAAHEKGVIHRDLKPGNVKVTPEGTVKVLDFGLAKAFQTQVAAADVSQSPTATYRGSREGVILGTAAYMSPEQARGKPLDKRTDIWSFGCVLYETLTGKQAFAGETASDTISAILKEEPDWSVLPEATPVSMRRLLRRCLHKEASKRLRDMGDSGIELDEAIAGTSELATSVEDVTAPPVSWWRSRTAFWSLAALLLGGIAAWSLKPAPSPSRRSGAHLTIPLPEGEFLWRPVTRSLAISPDGTSVVYSATRGGGQVQLFLRYLNRLDPEPLTGTEGALDPFFSPDGKWVGFFTSRGLHKVSLGGGMRVNLYEGVVNSRGASWTTGGTIYFVPRITVGIMQVSASGGVAKLTTQPDQEKDEVSHRFPHVLPEGRGLLVTLERTSSRSFDEASIAVMLPQTGELKVLVEGGMDARYAPTGHLVYARAGSLLAAPFDLARLELTGQPVPVLDGVITNLASGSAEYGFSRDGTLVYVPGGSVMAKRRLIWMDREGNVQPLTGTRRAFMQPALSPDGRRLAVIVQAADDKLWIYDLERDTLTRIGFEEGDHSEPIWSPDSEHVVFHAMRPGGATLFLKRADGSAAAEPLLSAENHMGPSSWSPDGRVVAFTELNPTTGADIWLLPLEGERKPTPFLRTDFDEYDARFSPDGKWLAYTSNESGREEVYVQPFPGPGGKWQMSAAGGANPTWAPNGQGLFYRAGNAMMSVALETEPRFKAAKSRVVFTGSTENMGLNVRYAVSPDGQRFLMVERTKAEAEPDRINVVLNWFEELKRLAPTGNN